MLNRKNKHKHGFRIHVNSQLFKKLCSAMRYFHASCMQDTIQPIYDFWEKTFFLSEVASQTDRQAYTFSLILKQKQMDPDIINDSSQEINQPDDIVQYNEPKSELSEENIEMKFGEEIVITKESQSLSLHPQPVDVKIHKPKEPLAASTPVSSSNGDSARVSDEIAAHQSASNLPPAPFMAKISKDASTGSNSFECTVCYQKFQNYSSLSRHRLKHTKAFKEFNCWHCSEKFTRIGEFRSHMKFDHNELYVFECPSCSKRFQGKGPLLKHESYCCQTKYECYFCGQMMNSYQELTNHSIGHYSCMFCGSRFNDISSLEKHEKGHLPVSENVDNSAATEANKITISQASVPQDKSVNTPSSSQIQSPITTTITLPPPSDGNSTLLLLTVDPETGLLKLKPISQDEMDELRSSLVNNESSIQSSEQPTDENKTDESAADKEVLNSSPSSIRSYPLIAPKPPNFTPATSNIQTVSSLLRNSLSSVSTSSVPVSNTPPRCYHEVKKSYSKEQKKMVIYCIHCSRTFKAMDEVDLPNNAKLLSPPKSDDIPSSLDNMSASIVPKFKKCNLCSKVIEDDKDCDDIKPNIVTKSFCQICGALFISKIALQEHLDRIHQVKPYILCENCQTKKNPPKLMIESPKKSAASKKRKSKVDELVTDQPMKIKRLPQIEEVITELQSKYDEDEDDLENVTIKSEPDNDYDVGEICFNEDCNIKPEIKIEEDILR